MPWSRGIPVAAAAAAIPLVTSELFWFLSAVDAGLAVEQWVPGLTAVVTRFANLVAAAVILHSYADLVRGPDRSILDVHPIQPRPLVVAIARHTVLGRLYLPLMAAVLLLPIGMDASWVAYAGSVGLVVGGWIAGIGIGFMVNLGAVWAAYSPSFSGLLEAVRGQNPKMQAALIYAPGVALLMVGLSVEFGAIGLESALMGWSVGWAWLGIPVASGLAAWSLVGRLADRYYVRASLLLAEVEGAWGQQEQATAAGVVYMQRVGRDRPELMRALRNGWRAQRLYATGGWILGLLLATMCWSDSRVASVWGAGAVVLVSAVATRLVESDPQWLDEALGVSSRAVDGARAVVAVLYSMGVWAPIGVTLVLQYGTEGVRITAGLFALSIIAAWMASWCGSRWRDRGMWAYGASGIVTWACFVGVMS